MKHRVHLVITGNGSETKRLFPRTLQSGNNVMPSFFFLIMKGDVCVCVRDRERERERERERQRETHRERERGGQEETMLARFFLGLTYSSTEI